ncbi:uncharacterized protein EI97DRAFT_382770 [Westerdykella ornata]|uniref:Protein FYV10 n=1 Tax=Westerdykella ornata TaxID=318751 RepID=A0A6A6JAZ2_WESOR|nr:uncharacterized protein EI97DRAFT_382770 [Westerdykella ornata]KAF2273771.1 hypothetical protein EI97DRAFT_382770 [Westerdykella ornata]
MAKLDSLELNAEAHLLLDQPLLRLPYAQSRQTFKTAQRHLEHAATSLQKDLAAALKTAKTQQQQDPDKLVKDIDAMIAKLRTLKRKLSALHDDEKKYNAASRARISHLSELYSMRTLSDVRFERWSRVRLNRLLVDYLLRNGYNGSALALARSTGIEDLVDLHAFGTAMEIQESLAERHDAGKALAWCKENSQALKKLGGDLELQLRYQQYIEMVMGQKKLLEAMAHAKKYLGGMPEHIYGQAAGLLTFKPWQNLEPYASAYSPARWDHLAHLFLTTHNTLFSLPPRPLLHIALSAGLSALKTPACHSSQPHQSLSHPSSSASPIDRTTVSLCPICSTELNALAENVPQALHTKSIVEDDPRVLPNGRVYGRERLERFNKEVGTEKGWVRDPGGGVDGEKFRESEVRKVFIL